MNVRSFRRVLLRLSIQATILSLTVSAAMLGGCGARSLVAVRDQGDQHYQFGEYQEALADYREYIERRPGNEHVHHMLGKTYLKLNEVGLGREQLYLAHTLRIDDDEIFESLCDALYTDKKLDDLNRLLRTRTIDKGRMRDWALLATYAQKLGDKDEAQRAWLTAAQVDGGKSIEPQLGLAKLYTEIGDTTRARRRLAMAYWIDPKNAEVNELIRKNNEIPGPTFATPPEELSGADSDVPPSANTTPPLTTASAAAPAPAPAKAPGPAQNTTPGTKSKQNP